MELDTHELAWAAGFFDGEGSISCSIRDTGRARMQRMIQLGISQNYGNRELVERFKNAIGGIGYGCSDGYKNNGLHGGGYQIRYRVSKLSDIEKIMELLWPYLGRVKKEQFETAKSKYLNHDFMGMRV